MTSGRSRHDHDAELARLVDAAHDGLVCFDGRGTVLYANSAAAHLLGLDGDLTGRPLSELPHALGERVEHCLEPGARCPVRPFSILIGDVTLSCHAWRPRSGPRTLAMSIRDDSIHTGRRERVDAVLKATTDGLLVLSPTDEVTFANPAALSMLHATEHELVGQHISVDGLLGLQQVAPPEGGPTRCRDIMNCELPDCPAYASSDLRCWLMSGTLCDGPSQPKSFAEKADRCRECVTRQLLGESMDALDEDFRELNLERNGDRLVVKVRITPMTDSDGDYTGQVIAIRDITSEYEIAQMKNEFVSTVSHELRTPLTSIKGYVDLILDGDAGDINDIQREFLSIVQENSDRLVDLINDMLDISRIESGRIHLKIEPQYMPDLIEGVVDTFRAVAAQSGRKIRLRVPEDLPPVAADGDRVRQVLINLVSNAIKYSPDGGSVTVSAKHTNGMVTVSVADKGMGISREDQKMLFTKFYRVDSAMTREIGGSGLGLSICKSIIELLGGSIGARSTLGQGSTFWFSLPVAPEEMIREPAIAGPREAGGTVLVVDSDPEIASLIETYLRRRGYRVYKAHNVEDALAVTMRVKPQVITLDVIMEGGDGFELIQLLKAIPETAKIPVVVLSIVCDEGRSCRFGAANYLEKPIDQDRLLDIVGGLVGTADSPLALVVDDDRAVVSLLSETLRRRGLSVAEAYDGTEAIAAMEKRLPDIMLLDLRMPKMDGFEVIRRVKTHPEWGDVPIVVMTAHPIESAHIGLISEVAARISKPLSPDGIAAEVERLLNEVEFGGAE
jgi:signal transduction histidine kinase/CheY-like chemotaxis protein/PAS domain-containing protein